MTVEEFSRLVTDAMGVEPTSQQRALIDALSRFCSAQTPPLSVFLLNGYAGTGKTSVVAALVKALAAVKCKTVLLAPTGRAAKVLGTLAGRKAYTIHRKIYRGEPGNNQVAVAGVADNRHDGAVFIVDEASMIGSGDGVSLLDDLCQYVYSGNGCRMILLGDAAQLPPVGCEQSPAMSVETLHRMGLRVSRAVLTETVRQKSRSGILYNATWLRRAMKQPKLPPPVIRATPFADVRVIQGDELEDELSESYSRYGIDGTILITRSNSRALKYNLAVRQRILEKEEIITRGEPVLISKNNYFWTSKIKKADFIANGDVAVVNRIYGFEDRGFLEFADVELSFPDRDLTFDAKIIINSLVSDATSQVCDYEALLLEQTFRDVDASVYDDPIARIRIMKSDAWFNSLRVKYAYAVTCHKAQGGQWDSVFVDMANIAPDATLTPDFYRWLYTAVTRAKTRLTFIAPTIEII